MTTEMGAARVVSEYYLACQRKEYVRTLRNLAEAIKRNDSTYNAAVGGVLAYGYYYHRARTAIEAGLTDAARAELAHIEEAAFWHEVSGGDDWRKATYAPPATILEGYEHIKPYAIVKDANGIYWLQVNNHIQHGPFKTPDLIDALALDLKHGT